MTKLHALGPDAAAPEVHAELTRLLLTNIARSLYSGLALVVFLGVVFSNTPHGATVVFVAACAAVMRLACHWHARFSLSHLTAKEALQSIELQVAILHFVMGVAWASLVWVCLQEGSNLQTQALYCVIAGLPATGSTMLSPSPKAFWAFATGYLGTFQIKLFAYSQEPDYLLAIVLAIGLLAVASHARSNRNSQERNIRLRLENKALLLALENEKNNAVLAQEQAEEANAAKSKFLATASHDLRQPVHALGLFLDVLQRTNLDATQRGLITNAVASANASSEMLNTLLDFSRIDAGVVELQESSFALQPLLNKMEIEFGAQANAKGLVYRTHETRAIVRSDPVLVEQVLRNLVSNAIRYTDQGGILVGCRYRSNLVGIEVWDTGIGIAPGMQAKVFKEFFQVGNVERDNRKGLGLGLAIAQGLAQTLNHPLHLRSRLGKGSVFGFDLPTTTEALATRQPQRQPLMWEKLNLKVLVIDDNEAVRSAMKSLLENWGCACEAVESVDEALSLLPTWRPDGVISDYRLRNSETGLDAIAALRTAAGQSLHALLVTGDTGPDRLRLAKASAIPMLHKPVSSVELHSHLMAWRNSTQSI
ncbi:ATP-binding response regulator [Rhodoferax aquaticus]|uniref:histidine kinase n=1 Tax=Rhodoferax aquaticus TaxID=2527691 RepID=A0A515EP94_9BURK|nr:hybrid sensor histidine kinase/response regulator [Rhodoferax aquaticus]QDL54469.1 response regulator [Rhodoferax aquaticus]